MKTNMLGYDDDSPAARRLQSTGFPRSALLLLLLSASAISTARAQSWSHLRIEDLPGTHAVVATPAQFMVALANSSVTDIHLCEDLVLSESVWPPAVLRLERNVTVASLAGRGRRLMNFTMVEKKVSIAPGCTLVMRDLWLNGLSYGDAPTFLTDSVGAYVSLRDGAWVAPMAPNGLKLMTILSMHPRPAGRPGWQAMRLTYWPFCIRRKCYTNAVILHNWASNKALVSLPKALTDGQSGHTNLATNWAWVADTAFSDACIALRGYDVCRSEAMEQHLRGQSHAVDSRLVTAALLATAVGCAALAAALVSATLGHRWGSPPRPPPPSPRYSLTSAASAPVVSAFANRPPLCPASSRNPNSMRSSLAGTSFTRFDPDLGRATRAVAHFVKEGSRDNVTVGAFLGAGGFARVYRGVWQERPVAVKIIPHDRGVTAKVVVEANLSMSLLHPNVVRTLHHFTSVVEDMMGSLPHSTSVSWSSGHSQASPRTSLGGCSHFSASPGSTPTCAMNLAAPEPRQTWIIQELCDLGPLSTFLKAAKAHSPEGHVDTALVLDCALDVAQGMAFLHEQNICHGDLKAGNTLLMSDPIIPGRGVVKVADFGLSRVLAADKSHLSTNTIGTITHMPPELLLNGQLTRECDVYSYGILMWEIASGEALYSRMNPAQIMSKVLIDRARPAFPAHVPEDFVGLAHECWAHDVSSRPPFTEVVVRLQGLINRWDRRVDAARRREERMGLEPAKLRQRLLHCCSPGDANGAAAAASAPLRDSAMDGHTSAAAR